MTFEVEVGGRTRTVTIELADRPGCFRVTVDRQPHLVDATRTSEFGLSLLLDTGVVANSATGTVPSLPADRLERGTVPGDQPAARSFDIHMTPADGYGQLLVNLQGRTVLATVNGRRTGHAADAGTLGHGEIFITSPMPGRVVRVLVAPGEEVSARQGVVVVEAMKMENELRAPRAGRVKEISVPAGTSVEAGRVLAVIE